jgi:hypothetical protein
MHVATRLMEGIRVIIFVFFFEMSSNPASLLLGGERERFEIHPWISNHTIYYRDYSLKNILKRNCFLIWKTRRKFQTSSQWDMKFDIASLFCPSPEHFMYNWSMEQSSFITKTRNLSNSQMVPTRFWINLLKINK